jgi:hypothetical protein
VEAIFKAWKFQSVTVTTGHRRVARISQTHSPAALSN